MGIGRDIVCFSLDRRIVVFRMEGGLCYGDYHSAFGEISQGTAEMWARTSSQPVPEWPTSEDPIEALNTAEAMMVAQKMGIEI